MTDRLAVHFLAPSGASNGQVPVFNSTTGMWELGANGTDAALYDAKGDVLIGSANDARSRLAVGSNGQVLTADSAQTLGVKWATPTAGYSDPLTTKGDILSRSSSATDRLAVGSDGQILIADSAQTLGVKWGAAPSGSVATDTIFDAKGDLPVGTAADTASRLAVGSNGQVLTADSTQSTGVKWATPSGGGSYPITRTATGTATNPSTSSTTYAAIDTACDVTIPASAGDKLMIAARGRWGGSNANLGWMDAATIVSSAIVNYCSGGGSTGFGNVSWMKDDALSRQPLGGPILYTVVSGDISGGNVVVRLIFRINTTGTITMAMDSSTKLVNQVVNMGPN